MNVVHKAASGGQGFNFILSDATPDGDGDVMEPNGWDLKRFEANPIALWDHGRDPEIGRTPIGKWNNTNVANGRLVSRLVPEKGILPKIDAIITLIERDVLRAVSVGFAPIEWEPLDKSRPMGGRRYKKQSLLEASVVAVPSNPAALALAKSLNLDDSILNIAFREIPNIEPAGVQEPVASDRKAHVARLDDSARVRARAKPFVIRTIHR